MVALLRSLHSQSSRRPRARQPFDRRRIEAHSSARLGSCCGSDYAPRRTERLFFSCEHFYVLARLDHGGGWWWIYLSGRARRPRRNVEARKTTCAGQLFGRLRSDRHPQYRLEDTWLGCGSFLGSTGCQPVLFGSLPKSSSHVPFAYFLSCVGSRRQAADDNRLAACAPQTMHDACARFTRAFFSLSRRDPLL